MHKNTPELRAISHHLLLFSVSASHTLFFFPRFVFLFFFRSSLTRKKKKTKKKKITLLALELAFLYPVLNDPQYVLKLLGRLRLVGVLLHTQL